MPEHRDRSFAAKVQCFNAGLRSRQGPAVRRHRQSRCGHLIRAGLLRVPAREIRSEPRAWAWRARHSSKSGSSLRLPLHEHRARLWRVPAVQAGVFRGDRRICAHQRRRHRLDGGHDGADEGLADPHVHREDLSSPPADGHRIERAQLRGIFRHGQKDYYLGGHPLWQVFRSAYQMTRPPF